MAKASDKRIAGANEKAIHNLQLGLLIVNLLAPAIRLLMSILTSRSFRPGKLVLLLHVLCLGGSLVIYRWFKLISMPRMGERGVKAGEDLGGGGVVELAWDAIYMIWICTLGSALLGDWLWWLLMLVPAFGAWKAFSTVRPLLAMFLPGIFGPKAPRDPNAPAQAQRQAAAAAEEPAESKRQAKLRARMEKGDKRIQQVQRKQAQ